MPAPGPGGHCCWLWAPQPPRPLRLIPSASVASALGRAPVYLEHGPARSPARGSGRALVFAPVHTAGCAPGCALGCCASIVPTSGGPWMPVTLCGSTLAAPLRLCAPMTRLPECLREPRLSPPALPSAARPLPPPPPSPLPPPLGSFRAPAPLQLPARVLLLLLRASEIPAHKQAFPHLPPTQEALGRVGEPPDSHPLSPSTTEPFPPHPPPDSPSRCWHPYPQPHPLCVMQSPREPGSLWPCRDCRVGTPPHRRLRPGAPRPRREAPMWARCFALGCSLFALDFGLLVGSPALHGEGRRLQGGRERARKEGK